MPAGATRLFLGVAASLDHHLTGTTGDDETGGYFVSVAPEDPANPVIAGIRNGAGFGEGPFAAGSIISIFGSNFGPEAGASSLPLPTTLSDTAVFINGVRAPLFFMSPGQINAQIPSELSLATSALVTVVRQGRVGVGAAIPLSVARPGIFTAGGAPVVINSRTGALVTARAPARRGDVLVMYGTGFGLTAPQVNSGLASPTSPLALSSIPYRARFIAGGSEVVTPLNFSGLAPQFVAVNQINVQVPSTAPSGPAVQIRLENDLAQTTWVTITIPIE